MCLRDAPVLVVDFDDNASDNAAERNRWRTPQDERRGLVTADKRRDNTVFGSPMIQREQIFEYGGRVIGFGGKPDFDEANRDR